MVSSLATNRKSMGMKVVQLWKSEPGGLGDPYSVHSLESGL